MAVRFEDNKEGDEKRRCCKGTTLGKSCVAGAGGVEEAGGDLGETIIVLEKKTNIFFGEKDN